MTMQELIERLKQRPKSAEETLEERKTQWLSAIDELFSLIESWLAPAVSEGALAVTRSRSEVLDDDDLGNYLVPSLSISDGRINVRLEPVGVHVVGVVSGGQRHTGFRGRVDVICGATKIPLVRTPRNEWRVLLGSAGPRPLSEDVFSEILGELLLDE